MKNKTLIGLSVIGLLAIIGCTQNIRSKAFGGTMNITLEKGQKLVNATWKDAELWYLVRPMHSNEVAETYQFIEKANFGLMEGKVIFQETK